MSRTFFVGGNFKLNPTTIDANSSLIGGLNKADFDPETGEGLFDASSNRYLFFLIKELYRGGDRTSRHLPHLSQRKHTQGSSSRSSELLL